jgi:TetR/AcrR family transcriptional regulator, transcriptional repressor for nem operon
VTVRKSRLEAAKTRERILGAAAAKFREHGIAATGLADLMSAAGLTHGGFYRHFDSKDQLVAETCATTMTELVHQISANASVKRGPQGLRAVVSAYLSAEHRDNAGGGCPLAALGGELARADEKTRAAATEGCLKLIEALAEHYEGLSNEEARKRAGVVLSTMVGALILSRVVADPTLSDAILQDAERAIARAT